MAAGFAQGNKEEHKFKSPEVEQFHNALHPVWHEQYPAKQWQKIRAQADELLKRKDAVMAVRLRVKPSAQAKAEETRKKFGEAVDAFSKTAKSGGDEELQKSVAAMHQAFEDFFDAVK